jgi:hypothetical protein
MNEKERDASIEYILARGLAAPQTTRARVAEMVRAIGFRHIFWDTGYSLLFAGITVAFVFALFVGTPYESRYSAAVAAAPLLFLFITVFAETAERASGLYELKQTCRYTARQVTALRVICYSVAGATFTALVAVAGARDAYEFLSLFPLCLSALFVCAALSMAVLRFSRCAWLNFGYMAAWVFVSIGLAYVFKDDWEAALHGVPVAVSAAAAVISAAAFARQVSRMLSGNTDMSAEYGG